MSIVVDAGIDTRERAVGGTSNTLFWKTQRARLQRRTADLEREQFKQLVIP